MTSRVRVVHYMHFDKKFTQCQINFLNRNFSNKFEQIFYVYGAPKDFFYLSGKNVKNLTPYLCIDFLCQSFFSDKIIFNGLFNRKIILLFLPFPHLLRKAIWIPWGYDIYWPLFGVTSLKDKIFLQIQKRFVKNIFAIASQTPGDYRAAIEYFGKGSIYLDATCTLFEFEVSDLDALIAAKNLTERVQVQIGNSADPSNNHEQLLAALKKIETKEIVVIAPLSYGDVEYASKISKLGCEIFGKKFISIHNILSPKDYAKHLSNIDILIFNHSRQQGFGNILLALYLGCKVFMSKHVTTYHYLTEVVKCHIFDTSSIGNISYEEFIEFLPQHILENRNRVSKFFDKEWQKERWNKLFYN